MAVAMGGAYPVAERTRGCRWSSRTYRPAEGPRAVTGQPGVVPGVVCVCVWAFVPRECVLRPYPCCCEAGGPAVRRAPAPKRRRQQRPGRPPREARARAGRAAPPAPEIRVERSHYVYWVYRSAEVTKNPSERRGVR